MTRLIRAAQVTKRVVSGLAVAFIVPAAVVLFVVMWVTTIDVILRAFFSRPLTGVADITRSMMVLLCWLGAAWVMVKERHIVVDILVGKLKSTPRAILEAVNSILGFGIIAVMAWSTTQYALKAARTKATLETLTGIPEAPFRFAVTAGASLLCVVLAVRFVEQVNKAVKGRRGISLKETNHTKEAKS